MGRPRTRGECADMPRPCPHTRCRYHLLPEAALGHRTPETCTLDLADRGEHTLEDVGLVLGVSRERVRQIEYTALRKILRKAGARTAAAALATHTEMTSGEIEEVVVHAQRQDKEIRTARNHDRNVRRYPARGAR